ncbi:LLM class flavin-dependent oxidoreductase [Streptomyces afghaniensis]|uniref:LLM class flavin-dependent oxidoreductase n=1 Tax=Streptomyces afghaniensis TaxID=66865 RepID=UPI0037A961AC
MSVLSTADPVRLHQDFASLDLISDGRTEIIAGRSAFVEAFRLFGVDFEDYDDVFAEKLRLLLAIRENPEHVTWRGRFRPAMDGLSVQPPPQQPQLPLCLGVSGNPSSVERAGRLGLPMALGLIGGDIRSVRPLVEHYRAVGTAAGHPADRLRLGRSGHFYVGRTSQGARDDVFVFIRACPRGTRVAVGEGLPLHNLAASTPAQRDIRVHGGRPAVSGAVHQRYG